MERFSRYLDSDGDGIAARTLPGVSPRGGYFTRGSGHDKHAHLHRGFRRVSGGRRSVGAQVRDGGDGGARPGDAPRTTATERRRRSESISLGGCHAAVLEAVDRLRDSGTARSTTCAFARFPFSPSVRAFIEAHPRCYVVEQNRDGQLRTLLAIETGVARDSMIVDPRLRRLAVDGRSCGRGRRSAREGTHASAPVRHRCAALPPRSPNLLELT